MKKTTRIPKIEKQNKGSLFKSKKLQTGQEMNVTMKHISNKISANNRITSTIITNVFINIPMPIEKPTNPSRYSFFQGLK
jgi:hypothetical protein